MEKGNIRVLSSFDDEKNNGLKEVNNAFIREEFLTKESIDKMADAILLRIKTETKDFKEEDAWEIILDMLQSKQIIYSLEDLQNVGFEAEHIYNKKGNIEKLELTWTDKNGTVQTDTTTEEELEPFLSKMRLDILNKIKFSLPDNVQGHILKKTITSTIWKLEGGTFYKHPDSERTISSRVEGLDHLYEIPENERSSFVYFGMKTLDEESGESIIKSINLSNVAELLDKKPVIKILNYLVDVLEGHIFLLSHNLYVSDNTLNNLGVNIDTDKGIVYDLDGIRKSGRRGIYFGNSEYLPPERNEMGKTYLPLTQADIIYELGCCIEKIVENKKEEIDDKLKNALYTLSDKMKYRERSGRITFREAQQELKEIIESLN